MGHCRNAAAARRETMRRMLERDMTIAAIAKAIGVSYRGTLLEMQRHKLGQYAPKPSEKAPKKTTSS